MSDTPKRDARGQDEDLARLDTEEESALAEALAHAVRPEPLSPARHEAILSGVGLAAPPAGDFEDDPSSEPSASEINAARALAEALDSGAPHPDADLGKALAFAAGAGKTAMQGDALGRAASERALTRALSPTQTNPGSKILFLSFGAAGAALALAASVVLSIGVERNPSAEEPRPELLLSRSLAPLLGAEASELSASARLDRIASARSRDFRSNRYARWGVR